MSDSRFFTKVHDVFSIKKSFSLVIFAWSRHWIALPCCERTSKAAEMAEKKSSKLFIFSFSTSRAQYSDFPLTRKSRVTLMLLEINRKFQLKKMLIKHDFLAHWGFRELLLRASIMWCVLTFIKFVQQCKRWKTSTSHNFSSLFFTRTHYF